MSKLGEETRGIYCGILGEYARESGEFQRPLHHVNQSNSEHQHERIQNTYTHSQNNTDTSWKFRHKGMCFQFVSQFWRSQLSIFFTLVQTFFQLILNIIVYSVMSISFEDTADIVLLLSIVFVFRVHIISYTPADKLHACYIIEPVCITALLS